MTTNWYSADNRLGVTSLMGADSVANQITGSNATSAIGSVVAGIDGTLGGGEFIYLAGVASLAVGDLVTYNPTTGVTALSPVTANLGEPVAVALNANTSASNYSWFQIEGAAVILKDGVTFTGPNLPVYQSTTTGEVSATTGTGKQILNCTTLATAATTATFVTCLINRPFMQGQII